MFGRVPPFWQLMTCPVDWETCRFYPHHIPHSAHFNSTALWSRNSLFSRLQVAASFQTERPISSSISKSNRPMSFMKKPSHPLRKTRPSFLPFAPPAAIHSRRSATSLSSIDALSLPSSTFNNILSLPFSTLNNTPPLFSCTFLFHSFRNTIPLPPPTTRQPSLSTLSCSNTNSRVMRYGINYSCQGDYPPNPAALQLVLFLLLSLATHWQHIFLDLKLTVSMV